MYARLGAVAVLFWLSPWVFFDQIEALCSSSSRGALHTLTELRLRGKVIAPESVSADLLTSFGEQGRTAVSDRIKAIQRLQLQLDRSDGRSDMTSDLVADKYLSFLSTCLRTEGGAWTATLGPMEYVGLQISRHVSWSSAQRRPPTRIINLPALLIDMGNCLIDLPSDSTKVPAPLRLEAAQRRLQDLSLALTRVVCRYALLQEQLLATTVPEKFALAIECPADGAHLAWPPKSCIDAMLRLDFGFEPVTYGEDTLLVGAEETNKWISSNSLN